MVQGDSYAKMVAPNLEHRAEPHNSFLQINFEPKTVFCKMHARFDDVIKFDKNYRNGSLLIKSKEHDSFLQVTITSLNLTAAIKKKLKKHTL